MDIESMASVSTADGLQYAIDSAKFTMFVGFACLMAASGGLMFGYDLGISGGVTAMDDFLHQFFPTVFRQKHAKETDNYCKFDSEVLTLFTSSLYLAGLIASFFASITTRTYGRKPSMLIAGVTFLMGSALNGAAVNLAMLIIGRIMLGVGVGFASQSVPLYLSEVAPPKLRGALTMMFQLAIAVGCLSANLINYGTNKLNPWGWRLSLALAAIPASIMTLGSIILPDTPNSLIERGYLEKGRTVLESIRGTTKVDMEFDDLVKASNMSKSVKHPWRNFVERRYRPQLVMAIAIPFFQQLTGINIITFYAPVLFQTIGFGTNASLYSAVIIGGVGLVATLISASVVDKFGRRALFIQGGCIMLISQVIVGVILALELGAHTMLSKESATIVSVMICIYVIAFAWSWGPLGWVVPSEIFPLEVRSAGMSINGSVNLLFTFIIAQVFLVMLCHLKWALFLFFASWVLLMTLFVFFLLPETKNVPLEQTLHLWQLHPFWSSFYDPTPSSSLSLPTQHHDNLPI